VKPVKKVTKKPKTTTVKKDQKTSWDSPGDIPSWLK
jgi:hypothetical protein